MPIGHKPGGRPAKATKARKKARSLSGAALNARTARLLREYVNKSDELAFEAERKANPRLTVALCELSDADAKFAAQAWRKKRRADAEFGTWFRSGATAIASYSVREQSVIQAMQTLCKSAPVPSSARYIYSSARAKALLAWLEDQPRSDARDAMVRPLRRAVVREHAFSIIFGTI